LLTREDGKGGVKSGLNSLQDISELGNQRLFCPQMTQTCNSVAFVVERHSTADVLFLYQFRRIKLLTMDNTDFPDKTIPASSFTKGATHVCNP
jgi:hypothetical protein